MGKGNNALNKSKYAVNNDEFYTTYETISAELEHYKGKLHGKRILCNCDDPFESNFAKFFIRNFNKLKLKRLVCTSYYSSKIISTENLPLDSKSKLIANEHGFVLDISQVPENLNEESKEEEIVDFIKKGCFVKMLNGTGDFRSEECLAYLASSDVVITNPPFSLFREIVTLIIDHRKEFLLIGNANALLYKEIFPLIKNDEAWIGYHFGDMSFKVPHDAKPRKTRYWIDDSGQKWRSMGNAMWFTNIDIERRHALMELTHKYDASTYPKFDNYDAIEVSRVARIPCDYNGIMAVPVTFLKKYNPAQFEIIGEANHGSDSPFDLFKPTINGKQVYKRILIKRR